MKMNKIDEDTELYKVKVFIEAFALGSDKDGLAKAIGQLDKTRKALTAAKKREAVDVDFNQDWYNQQIEAQSKAVDVEQIENAIRDYLLEGATIESTHDIIQLVSYLQEQGHLTSSEKPTHSIPDDKDAMVNVAYSKEQTNWQSGHSNMKLYKAMREAAKGEGE
jgi:hypothetical protein